MKKIYLDNSATTYISKEVKNEIIKKLDLFGNPSSKHSIGLNSKIEIENAREKIAKFINSNPEEIIFTSGATESNNLAIKGLALSNPSKKHIITSEFEHPSVLESCADLKKQGYEIDFIKITKDGIVDIDEIKNKIRNDTLLVSVMHVNNEIGTVQPIEEIGKICKEKKVLFHVDAVQSFTKIHIDPNLLNIDLLSASGHKINAMKGVGFLYIKKGTKIYPIINGGGQEEGIRSGTENLLGILSLSKAIEQKREDEKTKKSRDRIISKLLKIPGSILNGINSERISNIISISFYGIEGESLQMLLDEVGISISTGSACASNKLKGSHVLKSIGTNEYYLNGTIRISLDTLKPLNKDEEEYVIKKITESVEKLSKISPFKWKK